MVLQQDGPARIWGWAAPGEAITVSFAGEQISNTADASGHWETWLRNLTPGRADELIVKGNNTIAVRDVLVGEVWIAAGQSNMERAVRFSAGMDAVNAEAANDAIRLFQVAHEVANQPQEDVQGHWVVATAASISNFSALAYFFGKGLRSQRHVPVGLIEAAYGGTPIEAWESKAALATPGLEFVAREWSATLASMPDKMSRWEHDMQLWKATLSEQDQRAVEAGRALYGAPVKPRGAGTQAEPTGLFNGMIAPLQKYSVRGILWNQGENNAGTEVQSYRYRWLFKAMIEDWRRAWGEGYIPFLFVQLSRYRSAGGFPFLRESQAEALTLAQTGMVVSVDVGMVADVHYPDKQTLAERMLRVADKVAYGASVEASGPVLRQVTTEAGALRLWFQDVEGNLILRPAPIAEFATLTAATKDATTADGKEVVQRQPTAEEKARAFMIAGRDSVFVPAQARVEGSTIVLTSPEVGVPTQVCYAWSDTAPAIVLWNGTGLPASPFRASIDPHQEPTCPK